MEKVSMQPEIAMKVGLRVSDALEIHCHCLPGLDDGPKTVAESLELCRTLVADGIATAIATPHQLGRYDGKNSGPAIRNAVESLNSLLLDHCIPLKVLPGADVRLDERIGGMLKAGNVLTLADTQYLLLELPNESYIDPLPLIKHLARDGIKVIVSHPERYMAVCRSTDLVRPWVGAGALLQITSGSLLGEFGPESEKAAWKLLVQPFPLLISSDAHDAHARPPRLSRAFSIIEQRLGFETATRICLQNPKRILARSHPANPPSASEPSRRKLDRVEFCSARSD